jgi:hypothetical protein
MNPLSSLNMSCLSPKHDTPLLPPQNLHDPFTNRNLLSIIEQVQEGASVDDVDFPFQVNKGGREIENVCRNEFGFESIFVLEKLVPQFEELRT